LKAEAAFFSSSLLQSAAKQAVHFKYFLKEGAA